MEYLNEYIFANQSLGLVQSSFFEYVRELATEPDQEQFIRNALIKNKLQELAEDSQLLNQLITVSFDSTGEAASPVEYIEYGTDYKEILDAHEVTGVFQGFYVADTEESDDLESFSWGVEMRPLSSNGDATRNNGVIHVPIENIYSVLFPEKDHPLKPDEIVFELQKADKYEDRLICNIEIQPAEIAKELVARRTALSPMIGRTMRLLYQRDIERVALRLGEDGELVEFPKLEMIEGELVGFDWSTDSIIGDTALGARLRNPETDEEYAVLLEDIYGGALIDSSEYEDDQRLLDVTLARFSLAIDEAIETNKSYNTCLALADVICDSLTHGGSLLVGHNLEVRLYEAGAIQMSEETEAGSINDDSIKREYSLGEWFTLDGYVKGFMFSYSNFQEDPDEFGFDETDFDIKVVIEPGVKSKEYLGEGVAVVSLRDIAQSRLSRHYYN